MGDHIAAHIAERELAVGIEKVGMIGVEQLADHAIPLLLVLGIIGQPTRVARSCLLVIEILILRVVSVVRKSFF